MFLFPFKQITLTPYKMNKIQIQAEIDRIKAAIANGEMGEAAKLTALLADLATAPDAAPVGADVFATLRGELSSKSSFVAAQQGKRGGVQPLPFGPYVSNIDGETNLPAMIGLDKATGKGEERTYNNAKYNVALYFALTGGPVGATVGGRISQQMLADFPQFLIETANAPLSVGGTFGVTVKTVDGRRVGTLHVDQTAYADALAS